MLTPALPSHVEPLATGMREMDRIECGAFGREPALALERSLAVSLWALTAMDDEGPVAMLGVASVSMIEGTGSPWMLGSERIYDNARAMVKFGPGIIAAMERTFPVLHNYVSVANDRSIRFLRHWGWQVSNDEVDIGGVSFVRFANV